MKVLAMQNFYLGKFRALNETTFFLKQNVIKKFPFIRRI